MIFTWLFRKILLLGLAFGAGYWMHYQTGVDACVDAGGTYQAGICKGVSL